MLLDKDPGEAGEEVMEDQPSIRDAEASEAWTDGPGPGGSKGAGLSCRCAPPARRGGPAVPTHERVGRTRRRPGARDLGAETMVRLGIGAGLSYF